MAAIMALIFVPIVAAVGFMAMNNIGDSPAATTATLVFAALAIGIFTKLFEMAWRWDHDARR